MNDKHRMNIHFHDGSEMQFMFHQQEIDPMKSLDFVNNTMTSDKLVLEVEGAVYVFPYTSIKFIRISPTLEILPDTAITGLKIVS